MALRKKRTARKPEAADPDPESERGPGAGLETRSSRTSSGETASKRGVTTGSSTGKKRRNLSFRSAKRAAGPSHSYLCLVHAPRVPMTPVETPLVVPSELTVATYNVHRWTGRNGRRTPDASHAEFVLSELGADVIALQEVLRPRDEPGVLEDIADRLGLHVAFAAAREHKRGQLGNAILSRWPIQSASTLDISHSRIEKRSALAARFTGQMGRFAVIATHLSLVDRTRKRQVGSLMRHPELAVNGPAILMGDMNAWRRCPATRELDEELHMHDNLKWPSSFPSAKPVLALDRIYARGAHVAKVWAHDTEASRMASDHLPVIARVSLPDSEDWDAE